MEKYCYNCGVLLIKGNNQNKEHIPAKGLYYGLSESYKNNLITVPACFSCNDSYSKLDDAMRNHMIATYEINFNDEIIENSAKGLLRNNKSSIDFYEDGMSLLISEDEINRWHIKNFKGIYCYQYGVPIPDDYKLLVLPISDIQELFFHYLVENFKFKVSGHQEVFKYIIQPARENFSNNSEKLDIILNLNEPVVVSLISYYNTNEVIVIATRQE